MTAKRRGFGEGSIDQRGANFRLRYRTSDGQRHSVTIRGGTLAEARKQLRARLSSADAGAHVAPDRITLAEWVNGTPEREDGTRDLPGWLKLQQEQIKASSLERYTTILNRHILPKLGHLRLQEIDASRIDALYHGLQQTLGAKTRSLVHVVLSRCLGDAKRKKLIAHNPATDATRPKVKKGKGIGVALSEVDLGRLLDGFRNHPLFTLAYLCALTGLRRSEALALRWSDIDFNAGTISITRAVTADGSGITTPKSEQSVRTIGIDPSVVGVLKEDRRCYCAMVAGLGDAEAAGVDLTLVRIDPSWLVFPNPPTGGCFAPTSIRDPRSVSKAFCAHARKLGFDIRLHDLRHSHASALLAASVPVPTVAARMGNTPAVLLETYSHAVPKGEDATATAIATIAKGIGGR